MKVLFAVSNDNITTSVVKKYQQKYKEIVTNKNVYYFNAIVKELQKDKSYDSIVIEEDLEPISNNNYDAIDRFLTEKLDSISDEASKPTGEDIPIIFICADRRTSSDKLLIKLFSMGIYNALIGNDRSLDKLCELIAKPRSKKDAKKYYKIDTDKAEYKAQKDEIVSEEQIKSILNYYKKIGSNERKCVQAFDSISKQYDNSQLRIIVNFLPMDVKAILESRSPVYQRLMSNGTVLSNGQYTQYTPSNPNKPEKLGFISKNLNTSSAKPNSVVIPTNMKVQGAEGQDDNNLSYTQNTGMQQSTQTQQSPYGKYTPSSYTNQSSYGQQYNPYNQMRQNAYGNMYGQMNNNPYGITNNYAQQGYGQNYNQNNMNNNYYQNQQQYNNAQQQNGMNQQVNTQQQNGMNQQVNTQQQNGMNQQVNSQQQNGVNQQVNTQQQNGMNQQVNTQQQNGTNQQPNTQQQSENYQKDNTQQQVGMNQQENIQQQSDIYNKQENITSDQYQDELTNNSNQLTNTEIGIQQNDEPRVEEKTNTIENDVIPIATENTIQQENVYDNTIENEINESQQVEEPIAEENIVEEPIAVEPVKRRRGRPRKIRPAGEENINGETTKKRRGRPRKVVVNDEAEDVSQTISSGDFIQTQDETPLTPVVDNNISLQQQNDNKPLVQPEVQNLVTQEPEVEETTNSGDISLNELKNSSDDISLNELKNSSDDISLNELKNSSDDISLNELKNSSDDISLNEIKNDPNVTENNANRKTEEIKPINLYDLDIDSEDIFTVNPDLDLGVEPIKEMQIPSETNEGDVPLSQIGKAEISETVNETDDKANFWESNNQLIDDSDEPKFDLGAPIAGSGKIAAFVGTSKNGTSFIVNNVALLLSESGINTAVVDLTQNKNSYYMYTDNDARKTKIAIESLQKLSKGMVEGLNVKNNLTVFTSLPENIEEVDENPRAVLESLANRFEVVLLDCDFKTNSAYFALANEIYITQSMDAFTIQPLTKFLSDLKLKNILDESKLRIVINKYVRLKKLDSKMIIGGMSKYNEPSMTLQRDLFDPKKIKSVIIPFDNQTYTKYLESIAMCQVSVNGYDKDVIDGLEKVKNLVYPLVSGGRRTRNDNHSNYDSFNDNNRVMNSQMNNQRNSQGFSSNMNDTLNKMRKNNF